MLSPPLGTRLGLGCVSADPVLDMRLLRTNPAGDVEGGLSQGDSCLPRDSTNLQDEEGEDL